MGTQVIPLQFDKNSAWSRVSGRTPIFLDMNAWIELREGKNETSVRVRKRLTELVKSCQAFCPLSWGIIEELLVLTGAYLEQTASLMDELSLNAIYVMRSELYAWEFGRSLRRLRGEPVGTLEGLYASPAAFVGSRVDLHWDAQLPLSDETRLIVNQHFLEYTAQMGTQAMVGEQAVELALALEELPADQREAVRLRHLEGLTLAEIADRLRRSEDSIAGLLKRGMQSLRTCFKDEEHETK